MNLFNYKAYLNLSSGEKIPVENAVSEKEILGAVTVSVRAKCRDSSFKECSNGSLDADRGVTVSAEVLPEVCGIMADYRRGEYWCSPYFPKDFSDVPDETQLMVFRLADGDFVAVVPLVNESYKCVLHAGDKKSFGARVFSWCENLYSCEGDVMVYAKASRPSDAIRACVVAAVKLLGGKVRKREERRYPEILEYLGWCSWDSMQIRVCEEGILQKRDEFSEKGIPVRWMMLDDMWAHIKDFWGRTYADFKEMIAVMYSSAMYHFEADPIRFPGGLKSCISKLRESGMKVGIWHPTTGYWRGIDPDGEAYKILKDYLITAKNGYLVPDWHADKSFMYYNTLHSFFRACGAELVKIDNQSMTRRYYKGLAPVGKAAAEFHKGMEASCGANFDNAVINCMGMGSEDMWNRSATPVCRCSDDFLPENRAWFTKHIMQCAYNSLLQGELYYCDWDMWWTDDGQAVKNSVLRAVSGGPIYVSDMLGRSRPELLAPLCFSDGKILRADRPATASYDCVTDDPTKSGKAIKIQNRVGEHGILAAFNISEANEPVTAEIAATFVDGLPEGEYAVYEHFSGELRMLAPGESFTVTLTDADDFRLFILAPVKNGFAVIGRTDKLLSPASVKCIEGETVILHEPGKYACVKDGKLQIRE